MTRPFRDLARRYEAALRAHLQQDGDARLAAARAMSREALAAGMQALDLTKLHEKILISELLPDCPSDKRIAFLKEAGSFFANVIAANDETLVSARATASHLKATVETLSQRTVELAASNLDLNREITRRETVEHALHEKERSYAQLLTESKSLQEKLRQLSRQILSAQENERKEISRELHDIIAQTLTGINIRLAALKQQATLDTNGLAKNIASTQRLVEESVNIVHQFARELRPAVLDDLGLIPALHSYMKGFTARTGVRTHLIGFAKVEDLDISRRTVLFRVAQEALTNVARHAKATKVQITIANKPDGICMTIEDDGMSFQVHRISLARGSKRLGLLGMKERMEMVGGTFEVESSPDHGTRITARIPHHLPKGPKRAPQRNPSVKKG